MLKLNINKLKNVTIKIPQIVRAIKRTIKLYTIIKYIRKQIHINNIAKDIWPIDK